MIRKIVRENKKNIFGVTGADRIRRIWESMGTLLPKVLPKVAVYLITGVLAARSLEKKLKKQVGDKQGAYLLSQLNKSLPGIVTTELGLELGDLSDIDFTNISLSE